MLKKLSVLFAFFCVFILAGCVDNSPTTFSIQGRVLYNGEPIANVRVVSDNAGEVLTNEKGEFVFSDLTTATELTYSVEGYVFPKSKDVIYAETKNLLVNAEKIYTLTGRVVSNGIGIAGANVEITGLTPVSLLTDSEGYFTASVAGEVGVQASKAGYIFDTTKTATIDNCEIVLSGTTDVTAVVEGCQGATLMVGDTEMTLNQGVYSAQNIALGTVITPILQGYHFEPSSHTVLSENEKITFVAYNLYSVSGVTKSGDTPISDVDILVNGNVVAKSNDQGEFVLNDLWGENSISYSHSIFKFNSQHVTQEENLEAQGAFSLNGLVVVNGNVPLENVRVSLGSGSPISTDAKGQFNLDNVKYGDVIVFEHEGYKIDNYTITEPGNIIITAIEYFDATVTVKSGTQNLSTAVAKSNDFDSDVSANRYGVIEFNDLISDLVVIISAEGYTSQEITISRANNEITVNLEKYYDLSITVHSGDIILDNAIVTLDGNPVTLQTDGTVLVADCLGSININVVANGYNGATATANKDNNTFDFDLSYNVKGSVRSGIVDVDATITATPTGTLESTPVLVETEGGEYSLSLRGTHTITANAEGYTLTLSSDTPNIVKTASTVDFVATYSISGTLTLDNEAVVNATVTLVSDGSNSLTCQTDEYGKYKFDNLSGQYVLSTSVESLRPGTYTITRNGVYDFSSNGYAVSGQVLCGEQGLSGVTISAGDYTTVSGEDGSFTFDLITGTPTMSASKTGYTFDIPSYTLSPDNVEKYIFRATYTVSGLVMCGDAILSGVVVTLDDGDNSMTTGADGRFTFSGLIGTHELSFEKTDYAINPITITEYNNIEVQSTRTVRGIVKVGSTPMASVTISNGVVSATTNENGEFVLAGLVVGDELTASKTGYEFTSNNAVISLDTEGVEFSGAYNLSGTVKSAGVAIEGVLVTFAGKSVYTDAKGMFEFTGLSAFGEMTFVKAGYDFAPIDISGPSLSQSGELTNGLEVMATFAIKGRVTIGGEGLSSVSVSTGDKSAITDEDGYYTIEGLSTSGWVTLSKDGYEFSGETYYFSGAVSNLDFTATYYVRFSVNCGDADMGSAVITHTSGSLDTLTDNTFVLRGLVGQNTFYVNANALGADTASFDTAEVVVNGPKGDMVVELTYTVMLQLSKKVLDGITLTYSDKYGQETATFDASGRADLSGIVGRGSWTISKSGYKFTPTEGTYSLPKTVSITYDVVYSISGRVTSGNLGVYGMVLSMNGESTTTDVDGYYNLTNLVGSGTLRGVLSADNCNTVTKTIEVSGEGTYNLNVDTSTYAFWLYQKGYQNLRESAGGYIIKSTSTATPNKYADPQHAEAYKIMDKNGIYVTENKNHGAYVNVLGIEVEPRVDLYSYYDSNSGNSAMHYKLIKGDKISYDASKGVYLANGKGDYDSVSWPTTAQSLQSFLAEYGGNPKAMSVYNIQNNTSNYIKSISAPTLSGDKIKFTIDVSCSNDCISNYIKQIVAFSGQTPTFKSISLTITMDKYGNLISNQIVEQYTVTQNAPVIGAVTVTIDNVSTETITAYDLDNAIDISAETEGGYSDDTWSILQKVKNNQI